MANAPAVLMTDTDGYICYHGPAWRVPDKHTPWAWECMACRLQWSEPHMEDEKFVSAVSHLGNPKNTEYYVDSIEDAANDDQGTTIDDLILPRLDKLLLPGQSLNPVPLWMTGSPRIILADGAACNHEILTRFYTPFDGWQCQPCRLVYIQQRGTIAGYYFMPGSGDDSSRPVQPCMWPLTNLYLPEARPTRWRVEWRFKNSKTWFSYSGSLYNNYSTERQAVNAARRLRTQNPGRSYRVKPSVWFQPGLWHQDDCHDGCPGRPIGYHSLGTMDCKCPCHYYAPYRLFLD